MTSTTEGDTKRRTSLDESVGNDSSNSSSTGTHDVDGLLSRELMRLSLFDRNAIHEEVHGVRCLAVHETPELIRISLKDFQRELDKTDMKPTITGHDRNIPRSTKRAYNEIQKNHKGPPSPAHFAIDDDDFRLRFLRCELFDVPRAVQRFHNYLDFAYDYFGEISLRRPIRMTDLTKAEFKVFRKGHFQVLPFRDNSGRRVVVMIGGMGAHSDLRLRDKLLFYLCDVTTRDSIESQQKGFIILRLHGDISSDKNITTGQPMSESSTKINFKQSSAGLNRMLAAIPSRLVANHTRVPNHPAFRLVGKFFVLRSLSGMNANLRSRFIMGTDSTDLEFRYRLKSYGISNQSLPVTETDSIKCTYHNQWIKIRKMLEKQGEYSQNKFGEKSIDDSTMYTPIECPASNDVVFRKGSRVTSVENPGNRFFRDIIRVFLQEKEKEAEKLQETQIDNQERQTPTEPHPLSNDSNDSSVNNKRDSSMITPDTTITSADQANVDDIDNGDTTGIDKAQAISTDEGLKGGILTQNTEKGFCDWLVDHIENSTNGRFLEWNTELGGWIVMTDRVKITRKVSTTLYNWGKRFKAQTTDAPRQGPLATARSPESSSIAISSSSSDIEPKAVMPNQTGFYNTNTNRNSYSQPSTSVDDSMAYQFINGQSLQLQQECGCCARAPGLNNTNNHASNKRQRYAPISGDSTSNAPLYFNFSP